MQLKLISMSDKCCFILIPIDGMTEGLASNQNAKLGSNTHWYVGLFGLDLSLAMYWKASFSLRSFKGSSFASTCKLGIGDVLKAPRQMRWAAFCTRSNDCKYDSLADPYTMHTQSSLDRMFDLYNFRSVAQSAPQSLWATTFSKFIAFMHLSLRYLRWEIKFNFLSRINPRNLHSATTGMGTLPIFSSQFRFRVQDVLLAEMPCRRFLF